MRSIPRMLVFALALTACGDLFNEPQTADAGGKAGRDGATVVAFGPTVWLVEPAEGASFTKGQEVPIRAEASASSPAQIVRVDLSIDGKTVHTASTGLCEHHWDTSAVSVGSHRIGVIAFDGGGHTASAERTVTIVERQAGEPIVSLTAPVSGASFPLGSEVTIAATASADVGHAVAKVELFLDGALLVADTAAPYEHLWRTVGSTVGTHSIRALVTDDAGKTAESAVSVTLLERQPEDPIVSLVAPANQTSLPLGTDIHIVATAEAGAGRSVAKVELFVDSVLLVADTAAPYEHLWQTGGSTAGAHTLRAVVTDDAGKTAQSEASITLVENQPEDPTVSLVAPADQTSLPLGTDILIVATAEAAAGRTIAKVELLVDGALLATDTSLPYEHLWQTAGGTAGTHTIRAVATDDAGRSAQSEVELTLVDVTDASPPVITGFTTQPDDGASVGASVRVTVNVTDDVGVAAVGLYEGATKLGDFTGPAPSFTLSWVASEARAFALQVKARDTSGKESTSAVKTFTVDGAWTPPPA
ncbi:MAG: Ig-like domain-containing protein, partial [Deltaproteobacteria bacterium]|nr:Ig-like domain-containing protein [Deltaproteobacteria bacterium]